MEGSKVLRVDEVEALSHEGRGESGGAEAEGSAGGGRIELMTLAVKTLELTVALALLVKAGAPSCSTVKDSHQLTIHRH